MPCENKLDGLYFVVASFTWLLRASSKNRSYLRIKTTTIFPRVCCFNLQQGPCIVKLDSTKVGETDTRQPLVCRDGNGVESFSFSEGKMETERKYENGNGNLQKGNGNGIFYVERKQKWNGVFRWNTCGNGTFCFH